RQPDRGRREADRAGARAHALALRPASEMSGPRLYAHRGAAAELPENTLPGFERALQVGADALEMDVHRTRDGVIVVSHDPDGARCCGVAQAIVATDWAE